MAYQVTWVTDNLAVGHAPMSYDDLDRIRAQGIDAIVNLCGEFCDLHEIEEKSGFEVYYLPIADECAPDMEDMEKGLEWLDEAIYLGKKVLIYCRHGIGRTGTFVTSYLIRRGLALKVASKKLNKTRAKPTNYSQWRLLKKYGKKSGQLRIREPLLERRSVVDLSLYFKEFETLLAHLDQRIAQATSRKIHPCGRENEDCCYGYFELELIEAIFLLNNMNRTLSSRRRSAVIHRATAVDKQIAGLRRNIGRGGKIRLEPLAQAYDREKIRCPLSEKKSCMLYDVRPIRCRLHGAPGPLAGRDKIQEKILLLSRNVFLAFSGHTMTGKNLVFPLAEVASGRFVQRYFYYLAELTC